MNEKEAEDLSVGTYLTDGVRLFEIRHVTATVVVAVEADDATVAMIPKRELGGWRVVERDGQTSGATGSTEEGQ